jgi:rhomboid protease GluP
MENTQKRNSILCPNCRKLISTDEPECPYCGVKNPGSWLKNNAWTQGLKDEALVINVITGVTVAIYLLSLLVGMRPMGGGIFGILSPDTRSLITLGATGSVPFGDYGRWWTLISANYLHGGIFHILFNMMALRQLGPLVIQEYGTYRFVILYVVTGALGFWVSILAGVTFTVGASAAVCGLIGAMLYYGKRRGGQYGQAIFQQVGGWVIGLALFGFMLPGLNNWAHGGGIAAGIALGFVLGYAERTKETLTHRMLAGACALVTVLVLGWSVLAGVVAVVGA